MIATLAGDKPDTRDHRKRSGDDSFLSVKDRGVRTERGFFVHEFYFPQSQVINNVCYNRSFTFILFISLKYTTSSFAAIGGKEKEY
ncbi:hypothetical protein BRARA_F02026 [Brassica rapa]|uniref:Uncharacterized protein n=1 Tax=Brassica campestris TaxID=3711 RepID=A0A397YZU9_BRACM|nr:hypothetical protein BRARA_F02026 [Brassica rapa]